MIEAKENCKKCGGSGKCSACEGSGERPRGRVCPSCCGGGLCRCIIEQIQNRTFEEPHLPRPASEPSFL